MGIFIKFANFFIDSIGFVLQSLILLLPQSPFNFDYSDATPFMQLINWLIPIPAMLSFMSLYLPVVAIYYGLRVLLRQIKLSGG